MKDKYTLPMVALLLLFLLGSCMSLPGIVKDLQREQWCRENGYLGGVLKHNGRCYCVPMDSPVPILVPERLQ